MKLSELGRNLLQIALAPAASDRYELGRKLSQGALALAALVCGVLVVFPPEGFLSPIPLVCFLLAVYTLWRLCTLGSRPHRMATWAGALAVTVLLLSLDGPGANPWTPRSEQALLRVERAADGLSVENASRDRLYVTVEYAAGNAAGSLHRKAGLDFRELQLTPGEKESVAIPEPFGDYSVSAYNLSTGRPVYTFRQVGDGEPLRVNEIYRRERLRALLNPLFKVVAMVILIGLFLARGPLPSPPNLPAEEHPAACQSPDSERPLRTAERRDEPRLRPPPRWGKISGRVSGKSEKREPNRSLVGALLGGSGGRLFGSDDVVVWNFDMVPQHDGRELAPISVVMRGVKFDGDFRDGEIVEVYVPRWRRRGKPVVARSVRRLNGVEVGVRSDGLPMRLLRAMGTLWVLCFFLLFWGGVAFVIYCSMTGQDPAAVLRR